MDREVFAIKQQGQKYIEGNIKSAILFMNDSRSRIRISTTLSPSHIIPNMYRLLGTLLVSGDGGISPKRVHFF